MEYGILRSDKMGITNQVGKSLIFATGHLQFPSASVSK